MENFPTIKPETTDGPALIPISAEALSAEIKEEMLEDAGIKDTEIKTEIEEEPPQLNFTTNNVTTSNPNAQNNGNFATSETEPMDITDSTGEQKTKIRSIITTKSMRKKEEMNQKKLVVLEVIKEKKDILFGKIKDNKSTKKLKKEAWIEVLKTAQSLQLVGQEKLWPYARDSLYGMWKCRTLAKREIARTAGTDGGKEAVLDQVDHFILDMLEMGNPEFDGHDNIESQLDNDKDVQAIDTSDENINPAKRRKCKETETTITTSSISNEETQSNVKTSTMATNSKKAEEDFNDGVFILEVEKRPMIYDTQHKHYKNNNARAKAWLEIVTVLKEEHNISTTEVCLQKRWKALRGRYRKAVIRGIPNGGTKCVWIYQHLLGFLDKYFAENEGKTSQSIAAEDSNSSADECSHSSITNGEVTTEQNRNTGTPPENQSEPSKIIPPVEKMEVEKIEPKSEPNAEIQIKTESDKIPEVDVLIDIKTEADIPEVSDKLTPKVEMGEIDEKGDAAGNDSGAAKIADHAMWPQEETYKLINAFKEFEDQIFTNGINNLNIRPAIKYLMDNKVLDDKSEEQIKSKWRTLFRTYKLIRDKRIVANDTRDPAESNSPRYPYYSTMVALLGKYDNVMTRKIGEKSKVTRNTTKESQPPPPPPPPKPPVVETKESSEDDQDGYESEDNHIKTEEARWRDEYMRIKIEYLKMKKKHDTHKMNALKKLLKVEERKIELLTQVFDSNADEMVK